MRLLMITGDRSLAEGKRGAFYNTLEEFHKYWDRIDIICPAGAITNHQSPITNFFGNVFIHPSPWPLWLQPWWILKKGRQLYRENKFNLMTVHEYPPFYNGLGARLLWNKIKIPYVLEIFHVVGYPRAAGLKEKIYRRLFCFFIKYDCRKARAVRVMNNQIAEKLSVLGVPKSKINLIPAIYVDLTVFKPMNLEKRYDLIFVGRLAENKGIKLFLEAVKNMNAKAVIVGSGPLEEKLKTMNRKLKADATFYGWAKDSREVAELINQSKLLVMSSYSEGGPRVVLEAMACGVPVLATPVGIVPDIIKNGESGMIINWDPVDIVLKAKKLLSDGDLYNKCGAGGIKTAKQFEKKLAIRNYADKLKETLLN